VAECREVSFSHDSETDMTRKPEEDLSGFMSVPLFDRKPTSEGDVKVVNVR
jgi:hypothetical protein